MKPNTTDMPRKLAKSAYDLFSKRGINGINMDTIAAKAKVTKGSLYWHYKSKTEVTHAAAAHYYQNWYRQAHQVISDIQDPLERLEKVIKFSVKSCLLDDKNRIFTMEIWTYSLYNKAMRQSWAQFYEGVREFYIGLVEAARRAEQLYTSDPRQAVDLMLVAMEGLKQRALFEPHICSKSEEEQINEGLLKILKEF